RLVSFPEYPVPGTRYPLHPEVARLRMVDHQRRDARFGIHHVAFGELDADVRGLERRKQGTLAFEIGTGRVAEGVALAAVPRREAVSHRQLRRIREPPRGPQPGVQAFRRRLGELERNRGPGVAPEVFALLLELLDPLAHRDPAGRRTNRR